MKTLQAYLKGTFLAAAVLGSVSLFAQEDTLPNRTRDTSKLNRRDHKDMDHHRKNKDSLRSWDRNAARSDEAMAYTYIDLNSGDTLDYWYDADKKIVMNRTSNLPVDFYINTSTMDTVYGRGRFVVNGFLLQGEDGKWKFNEEKVKIDGDELKIKDGSRKLKIDGDDIKIKDKGRKVKLEGGEAKIKDKENNTKAKVDDKQMKVKDENGKAKYKENKTKIKDGDEKIKRKTSDTTRIEQ